MHGVPIDLNHVRGAIHQAINAKSTVSRWPNFVLRVCFCNSIASLTNPASDLTFAAKREVSEIVSKNSKVFYRLPIRSRV